LVHGDFTAPNVHFNPIEGNFFLLKGLAEGIFNNLLKINIKFIKESHPYCDTFHHIIDSQKNVVGSIGIINKEFLNKAEIEIKNNALNLIKEIEINDEKNIISLNIPGFNRMFSRT